VTRPFFVRQVGAPPSEITHTGKAGGTVLKLYRASPGLMSVLCEGEKGGAFYVCRDCGFGAGKFIRSHKTPYGKSCSGPLERVALGQEFETDLIQIDPVTLRTSDPLWDTLSLAYALSEGAAEVLEIPSSDLSATAFVESEDHGRVVLYDNVPGGAGLVARLEHPEMLRGCLAAALRKVQGACGCGADESCYSCLRSYRNQFAHRHLKRGVAARYLEWLLGELPQA